MTDARAGKRWLAVVAVLLLLGGFLPLVSVPAVRASPGPLTKDLTFYFHYTSNPPQVGGVFTNYIFNTTNHFQTTKNNDFKGIGQPKITLDFYLTPSLAGAIHLAGDWKVIVFANSTALHPATWGLEFWEKSSSGQSLWDSGTITPNVLGGPSRNNGYIDSPVYGYTLSVNLTHSFSQGSSLQVEITVNTGSTVPLRVWYDSPYYPSRAVLPSNDYARVVGLVTQDANGTARTTFFSFWNQNQRKVVIVASVTDPFGGYDLAKVWVQVRGPGGAVVVNNASTESTLGGPVQFTNTYAYTFSYGNAEPQGTYSVQVAVVDNNGQIQFKTTGTYAPFIEYRTTEFSIGIQYPVTVKVVDSHGNSMAGAFVKFVSGGLEAISGKTGLDGTFTVTLFTGTFVADVVWEGVDVANQSVKITNSTLVVLAARVYYPTFVFASPGGTKVQGLLAFVTYPNGTTGRLPLITDSAGSFVLSQQPAGNYSLLAFLEGVKVADQSERVESDGPFAAVVSVYKLTVNVTDSSNNPLSNSTVLLQGTKTSNALVYRYAKTGSGGVTTFELPAGDYRITAEYYNVYWLSLAKNSTTVSVSLASDVVVPISMKNIPPPIWLDLGFQLLVIVLAFVLAVGIFYFRSRHKTAK